MTLRIQVIMERRVPICGEKPSRGPITFSRLSARRGLAEVIKGRLAIPKVAEVKKVEDFRKSLRVVDFVSFMGKEVKGYKWTAPKVSGLLEIRGAFSFLFLKNRKL